MGARYLSLDDPDFNRHFTEFEFTAYRLESLQRYDVTYERDEFRRFLAGESRGEFPGIGAWVRTVREAVNAGKRVHRVHVVQEPLSDYVRFECGWAYEHTVAAGEDVRVIPLARENWPAGLPRYDYWLFDSTVLVEMHYDAVGTFQHAELVDDPRKVVRANYWRDLAVTKAVPYRDYAARLDRRPFEVV
ncbi:DUF6879 family protein [Saccharothrix obliqua]|uniref:DUF6879 family protein n=1 Tax=Saccharothrix obliqua TaxID=2861747 RepID=UPI001C5D3C72|nr:DUF6879 family protein [Saccharothrix obliqua]MBW4718836.1 hypothetical protein [Saccharothrix obliqua]